MADAFPISGSIDPKSFPFLLVDLHRHGATGSLKVEGPSYQKALYFRGGRILFGSSNDPRDQLGAILIESGKITPEQLEDVNAKVGPGNPLAKVLAETGFVSQRELGEAARAKVERILSDVIAYDAGSFEFEDGVLPKGAVDLKLSTEQLVLAAVRAHHRPHVRAAPPRGARRRPRARRRGWRERAGGGGRGRAACSSSSTAAHAQGGGRAHAARRVRGGEDRLRPAVPRRRRAHATRRPALVAGRAASPASRSRLGHGRAASSTSRAHRARRRSRRAGARDRCVPTAGAGAARPAAPAAHRRRS